MNEHVEKIDPLEAQRQADARAAADRNPGHRRAVAFASAAAVVAVIVGVTLVGVAAPDRSGPTPPPVIPTPTVDAREAGTINVPSLVGLTQQEATMRMLALGLEVRVTVSDSCEPGGTVIGHSPKATERVPPGSRVEVFVASEAGVTACPVKHTVPRAERELAADFVAFARSGEGPVPLAASVGLGQGERMQKVIGKAEGQDPASWGLCAGHTGSDCPVSALSVVAEWGGETHTDAGPVEVCGVPGAKPPELVGRVPVSIRPALERGVACAVWSVDLYVDEDGRISDVVLRRGPA